MTARALSRLGVSVKEASVRLSLSEREVQQLCQAGKLTAWQKVEGGTWRIDGDSVEAYWCERTGRAPVREVESERAAKLRELIQVAARVQVLAAELLGE